jgi:hypothetical protein
VPHGRGTTAPPGTAGPTGAVDLVGAVGLAGAIGPAGAAAPTPWLVSGPMHLLSHGHNLDERDRPRKLRFDRLDEVRITWINGSTCPVEQPPQLSFQGNPRRP